MLTKKQAKEIFEAAIELKEFAYIVGAEKEIEHCYKENTEEDLYEKVEEFRKFIESFVTQSNQH